MKHTVTNKRIPGRHIYLAYLAQQNQIMINIYIYIYMMCECYGVLSSNSVRLTVRRSVCLHSNASLFVLFVSMRHPKSISLVIYSGPPYSRQVERVDNTCVLTARSTTQVYILYNSAMLSHNSIVKGRHLSATVLIYQVNNLITSANSTGL